MRKNKKLLKTAEKIAEQIVPKLTFHNDPFEHTQKAEAESWLIEDEAVREDKASRETIRYPLLKKQMGLNYLDTSKMKVADIGCGPLGGVSTILQSKVVTRIDPLMDEYKKFYPINNGYNLKAEEIVPEFLEDTDLVIITNALDHFANPEFFLQYLALHLKPGGYFAHIHAINNAITHKHEAHAHNVNPEMFKQYLSDNFEQVWGLDYQNDGLVYGWRKQPAFSGLYRKVAGYKK